MTGSLIENSAAPQVSSSRTAGFTLMEVLIVLAIVTILAALSIPVYNIYINKAKITLAKSVLGTVRTTIEDYNIANQSYPLAIDFTSGLDGLGRPVLPTSVLADFNRNIFAVDSYIATSATYTLSVRAIDPEHTLLILTPGQGIAQGP